MGKFKEYLEVVSNKKNNNEIENFKEQMLKNDWNILESGNSKILEFEKQNNKVSIKMYVNLKDKTYHYNSHLWENSDSYYDVRSKHIKFKNVKEIKILKTIKEAEGFIDKFYTID